ncbi:MAG: dienelactone hydrolase family protein [Gammaproteobacteria bacterium]|nr:dienelactone hydrolase family protein [Gammaproteobacteria bacterium]
MIERNVDIQTADGLMNSFIVYPEEGGPFPVVLFLMDAPGKREELHDMARRLATTGYYVVLPNLYYRRAREFVIDGTDASRARMFEHMNSLSNAMVCADAGAVFDFLSGEAESARGGPAGCVGYCMSGPFSFAVAAAFPDRIAAAASVYGVRLCTDAPDSPHRDAAKVKGELYFACAQTDEWAPKEMIDKLAAHLATTKVTHRVEWFPGTHHGFAFPSRTGMYDKAAAERHWERLHDLFKRRLS